MKTRLSPPRRRTVALFCVAAILALLLASAPCRAAADADRSEPSMQARFGLLVDDAHHRAVAHWRQLQAVPEELTRVAADGAIAWESGAGLRAITYTLILLLIGGGIEWLYWCYAGRARQAIAETVLAESLDAALPPRRAGSLAGRRALIEICGCSLFALGMVGASSAFSWPAAVQEAVLGVTFVIAAVRLTGIAIRVLLAPGSPRLRLLPLDDPVARRVRRIALGVTAIAVGGASLAALCDGPLGAPALAFAIRVGASAGVCGFALDGIRLWSARPRAIRRGRALATASIVVPFLAVAAVLAFFVSALLGAKQLGWSIAIGFLALLAQRAVQGLIEVFTAPQPDATADRRIAGYRPVLRRISLFAVVGAALAALAAECGVSMHDMPQSGGGFGRLLGPALDITVVVLLADLIWLWAKTAIDRRVTALAPCPAEAPPGAPADPGTRLATLMPLLRKAILAVIVAAATLISLSSLGIDIAPLLAGAGVVGIAIGFGAQTVVRDIVSGIFYLLEDAFRIGEYVEFGQIRGTVEGISLRFLRLRHHRGAVHTIPFGEIRWLTNQSRDWQIMKLEFRVPFDTDVGLVKKLVREVGEEMLRDAELGPWLLETVKSRGVIRMEEFCMVIGVKFTARPGDGVFLLRREAYHRILEAFAANGIRFADRHVKVEVLGGSQEAALIKALSGGAAEIATGPAPEFLAYADEADRG